jgi:hypothetical protein
VPNLAVADWATSRVRNKLISLNLFFGGEAADTRAALEGTCLSGTRAGRCSMAGMADHPMAAVPTMQSDGEQ